MRHLLIPVVLVAALGCSTDAQQPTPAPGAKDPAARVGDRTITIAELDEAWLKNDPAQHAQATQALYDGRRAALDAFIADMLIEQAAKAKGVTAAAFVQEELSKRTKVPADGDIANFYIENRGQMQGRSLEEMIPLIRQFLTNQRTGEARAELIAELRKAGPAVRVLFDAPRQQVAVSADDPADGPATAPVTLVEYSDFQCPFCQRVMPTLKQVREKYGDKVRVVWKDFPLTQIHPQAFGAAVAGNCAREQGKFWELHDRLFPNQQALQPEAIKQYAVDAGLDAAKFNACLDSTKYQQRVQDAITEGTSHGVSSTPTVFINGRVVSGAQPFEAFAAVIDEELARAGR
ncbi:MAG: thioredoxin domain-containing protein [Vicinamibacterales bacterium]